MNEQDAPRLRAWAHPDGIHWLVWCAHCERYHQHGAKAGFRVPHCATKLVCRGGKLVIVGRLGRDSPYWRTGYILVGGTPASKEMVADARCRNPRGPAVLGITL
jgi:hypothetical protein